MPGGRRAGSGGTKPIAGSVEATHQAIATLLEEGELLPPEGLTLRPGDLPFWRRVVAARARADWSPTDLESAYALALTNADIARMFPRIKRGGMLSDKPNALPDPRVAMLNVLTNKQIRLMRVLGLTSAARRMDSPQVVAPAAETERQATEAVGDVKRSDDLDLFTRPGSTH